MKERTKRDFSDRDSLEIYPYLEPDATPREMSGHGYVEARHYWNQELRQWFWGVRLNMSFMHGYPSSRDETDRLVAAINRAWEWIAEQERLA